MNSNNIREVQMNDDLITVIDKGNETIIHIDI